MVKNKIINKIISVVILSILLASILPINVIKAVTDSSLLISVGTGNYSITVTTSTTVNDIIKVLGQPKLKTVSAFGGNAYAFYTDSNYSNYLYIETTANDKEIVSYGSVVPSYKTATYSYNDNYNYRENGVFHGCLLNEDGKVHGGIYYNKTVSGFYNLIDTFKENFKSNETYRKSAAKQGIVMYNALSVVQGQPANLVFDEDLYKYNEDLKKQGTSLQKVRQYVPYEYTVLIKSRENIGIQNSVYYVFNPMMYASMARASTNEDLGNRTFAFFDYDIDSKILFATAVNSDFKNALKSNSIAESMVDEETSKVESSILYALSLLDDKMTDADKAQILAQYVQEGNDYSLKDKWRGYKWMLLNHAGVCDDFAETCRTLLNRAGILCEKVSSRKADHAWNICFLDNNWCYVDTTKGAGRSTGAKSTTSPYGFYGKTRFNKYSTMYENFVDAISIEDVYNPLPEGKDAEITNADSRIYYDETYKYYIQDSLAGKQEGLFRENRITGEKKLLTDKVLVEHSYDGYGNIVKQGSKIYFVGDDAKQIKSISLNGTNEKQEFKLNSANEEISGIYVQDGYIWYIKFNTSTKKDEYVKYKQISDYPTVGTYTLNDSKHKFSLKYIQNSKGVVITQCIGIGNNLPQGEIYIPNTINGKPVVGIGENAFEGVCGLLTGTLVLPENLEFIGQRGFSGCKNITGIQFNNKLNSIGLSAFSNNDKVTNITLPDSLTYMDDNAFFSCDSLTNVNLGKGLQVIHNSIFENCISLKQITFPSTVKRISEYALKGTTSLKNVIIESKQIEKMGFDSEKYDIYLYGGTTTSNYADANNIKYKDLRTNKPTLEKPTLSIDKNMLQINSLSERPKITATLSDGSNPNIIWTSKNEKIATVSNGIITPKAGGFTYIEAYDADTKNLKVSCWVYVCALRTLSDGSKAYPGDLTRDGIINGSDSAVVLEWYNKNLNLTEDEIVVGDVDGDGEVNGTDSSFILDIYNKSIPFIPGKYNPVTNVTLSKTAITLAKAGNTETITASFNPTDTTDSPNVIWSTSDSKVATVVNGKITAIAPGTANITATVGTKSATCTVTIPTPTISLIGIDLNKTTLTLEKGKSEILTVTYNPNNTTESKTVTWKSSNSKVATVVNGKITAVALGTATITATVNGKNATCKVTVPKEQETNPTKPTEPEKPIDPTEPEIDYILGDVDGNGKIDAKDAVMILKHVAHNITLNEKQLLAANTNKDKKVDAGDAVQILKYVAHNITEF